jgi:hypothetical protein
MWYRDAMENNLTTAALRRLGHLWYIYGQTTESKPSNPLGNFSQSNAENSLL